MYAKLQKYRKRDINLQLGVGNNEGKAFLRIKGKLSRCSSIELDKKQKSSNNIEIKVITMTNICKTYIPKGTQIEFCKIDVEGYEKNVLLGYDFINYRPKVFCIESLSRGKGQIPYQDWEYIFTKNNYIFAYQYGRNRYYYDKNNIELKNKFKNIHYYVQKYYNKN